MDIAELIDREYFHSSASRDNSELMLFSAEVQSGCIAGREYTQRASDPQDELDLFDYLGTFSYLSLSPWKNISVGKIRYLKLKETNE